MSTVLGTHVAAVAVDAATRELCQENPSAWLAFETNGDKTTKPVSPPYKNEFKRLVCSYTNYHPRISIFKEKYPSLIASLFLLLFFAATLTLMMGMPRELHKQV